MTLNQVLISNVLVTSEKAYTVRQLASATGLTESSARTAVLALVQQEKAEVRGSSPSGGMTYRAVLDA